MNSENSKTSDPHSAQSSRQNKLKKSDKYVALSNLAFTIHGKMSKTHTKIINLKFQLRHGIKSLNYLMDHVMYEILFSMYLKKIEVVNLSIMIYVNKPEN